MKRTELEEMLSYCRPAGSSMEDQFLARFIDPLGLETDGIGNRILKIGDSPILWASHFDTVHRKPLRQKVHKRSDGRLYAASKHSNCLGGDDTCGVWLMVNLIRLGIPGLYIFHYGEEVGCLGSGHIGKNSPELLDDVQVSIALDRRGLDSLVTHQSGMEGCSDEFATALATQLNMGYRPDPGGIWTDNVEYFYDIPENVNLSVGYFAAHSSNECVDPGHLARLLDALCELDQENLPIVRDPETAMTTQKTWYSSFSGKSTMNKRLMAELVKDYPDEVAAMLYEYGFDEDDLFDIIGKDGRYDSRFWDAEEDRWWESLQS